MAEQGIIYIIELQTPLGSERHSARYYLGWTRYNVHERLNAHRKGQGSAMLRAAAARGIPFDIVATFPGTRDDERRYKRQKNHRRLVARFASKSQKNGTLRGFCENHAPVPVSPQFDAFLQALASYARFEAYTAGQSFQLSNDDSWQAQYYDAWGRFDDAAEERRRFAREQAAYAANPDLAFQALIFECKANVGLAHVARRTGQAQP